MADDRPWVETVAMPALLRAARRTYGAAVRAGLAEGGFDDLPGNGPYVIGGIARQNVPLSDVIEGLGVSKQAAGQLVDTLVMRGYLDRTVDPDDRRRLRVTLTERGAEAATVVRSAVEGVDRSLVARIGAERVAQFRAALGSLIEVQSDGVASHGSTDPGPEGPQ